ncbi:MAG: hypothetical protein JO099_19120 [Acidobacteriia bacterium]|nr:hypothetical protein [Terriglobia bacterium]
MTTDSTTIGNWKGTYGADGYQIANDATNLPAYVRLSLINQSNYTWAFPTTDPRALQQGTGSSRIAACWYSPVNFTVDINITDGGTHAVALYVLDWPDQGRAQNMNLVDASTGHPLDSRLAVDFSGGQYFVWNVSGHVQAKLTLAGGPNAVVGGIFFGPPLAAPPPPPPPPPGVPPLAMGPGGPILLIGTSENPFSYYYAEILRAEGMNTFATADIANVTASTLSAYDVVILGQVPLTAAQVSMFSSWVSQGGNLIAMRPDKQLAGLLGITDAASTLSDAYLLVNTSAPPGAGIVSQTVQYHGTADLYTITGATAVATLYQNATTATANPAITLRSLGTGAGNAAAFTYDLAKSIALIRQGNPAWAGEQRDASWASRSPQTPHNLFFGAATFDPEPDWVNLDKSFIPHADEQQRLLMNLIELMNSNKKPLPRFWYFPSGKKAIVVMTGDDHATGGTAGRFDYYTSISPSGCVVANWQCIRSTSYIYPFSPLTDAQAIGYNASGFEVALHVTTNALPWSPSSLDSTIASQQANWHASYPDLPLPVTNRTHATTWSDYTTEPKTELAHGIRLDVNYATGPSYWTNDRVGFMTGSGMMMRFADVTGSLIDVYQALTEMWDSPFQQPSYQPAEPQWISTLLNNALGPQGYYGAFTVLAHTDLVSSPLSDAVLAAALPLGVPIVSSLQMLKWLDGRGSSSFGSLAWDGHTLSFAISQGQNTNGLQAMVPSTFNSMALTSLTCNGASVSFTTQTIKGIGYAFFPASTGFCQATYGGVVPVNVTVTPAAVNLQAGQTQQFTAVVTGSSNTAVTWSSQGAGSISSTGLYTAPAVIATQQAVTITATSQADSTKKATAVVTLLPRASAQFLGADTSTQGTWKGVYGSDGFEIANDSTNLPAYASVAFAGQATWTWASSTSDVRALQQGAGSSRIASCWYSGTSFTVDINLTDGQSHVLAMYMVDWDIAGRIQRMDVIDANSGIILDTRTVSSFTSGQYLSWSLSGHVTVRMTVTGGVNAVVSGLFFNTPGPIPLSITQQPQNATVGVGQSAGFSVSAKGNGLSYQWQSKPSAASSFANISGATSSSYTTPPAQLADSGTQFRCNVMDNTGASITTNTATLTVTAVTGTPFTTAVTLGALRNDYSGWVGMSIRTGSNALTVTALGRIVLTGDSAAHTVKLVNGATGLDVPGASAPVSTVSGSPGNFAYTPLSSPVTLNANTVYYVVTQEVAGGDVWCDYNGTIVQTTNAATVTSAVYSSGSAYIVTGGSGQTYGPVDFRYH